MVSSPYYYCLQPGDYGMPIIPREEARKRRSFGGDAEAYTGAPPAPVPAFRTQEAEAGYSHQRRAFAGMAAEAACKEYLKMRSIPNLFCAALWCLTATAHAQQPAPQQPPAAVEPAKKLPFEAEIVAFEAADKQTPPPTGAVLFIGSSSIRLWSSLAKDFPELTVINRGFGGSEIADSVRYAPRIVLPYKPKMIVFYAGGNDINAGKTPETVLKNYKAFVTEVHKALPKTRIVYISMNPAVSRWKKEAQFVEGNRLIQEYVETAAKKGMPLNFIDTHSKLLSESGEARPEIYRTDGLHLNAKGYALWTSILHPQILALAGVKKQEEKVP